MKHETQERREEKKGEFIHDILKDKRFDLLSEDMSDSFLAKTSCNNNVKIKLKFISFNIVSCFVSKRT